MTRPLLVALVASAVALAAAAAAVFAMAKGCELGIADIRRRRRVLAG